ncbi:unnamed protein product, partial [Hapterophycus canaliculatus]
MSSPSRLRHPRNPSSPETAYRNAVQAYLSPPATAGSDAGSHGNTGKGLADRSRSPCRQTRSVSPTRRGGAGLKQRSRWCSPVTMAPRTEGSGSVSASSSVHGCGGSVASAPAASAAFEKEGVPPLLLEPSEWGLGLGGEWVSARRQHMVRGVGRVSLTWADIRGNTLLHLAAIHNDVALTVLGCEKKRRKALERRERRRERVLVRARQWNERSQKEAADKKDATRATKLKTKDILKRIK